MEILKKGREQSTEWIGECDNCGCIFKNKKDESFSDYTGTYYLGCPNCMSMTHMFNLGTKPGQVILYKIV